MLGKLLCWIGTHETEEEHDCYGGFSHSVIKCARCGEILATWIEVEEYEENDADW